MFVDPLWMFVDACGALWIHKRPRGCLWTFVDPQSPTNVHKRPRGRLWIHIHPLWMFVDACGSTNVHVDVCGRLWIHKHPHCTRASTNIHKHPHKNERILSLHARESMLSCHHWVAIRRECDQNHQQLAEQNTTINQ